MFIIYLNKQKKKVKTVNSNVNKPIFFDLLCSRAHRAVGEVVVANMDENNPHKMMKIDRIDKEDLRKRSLSKVELAFLDEKVLTC